MALGREASVLRNHSHLILNADRLTFLSPTKIERSRDFAFGRNKGGVQPLILQLLLLESDCVKLGYDDAPL